MSSMKGVVLFVCLALVTGAYSQTRYHCSYTETVHFVMPDSSIEIMRNRFLKNGYAEAWVNRIVSELTRDGFGQLYARIVDATPDSTVIFIKSTNDDKPLFNIEEDRLLFQNGNIYGFDQMTGKWFSAASRKPVKTFVKAGKTSKLLEHDCIQYYSTDSTCTIWVAASLPSYINPGISVGDIPGAVLAFNLRTKESFIRSEIMILGH